MLQNKRQISKILWTQLIKELCLRGEGERETGAFLLGKNDSNIITQFICYNDLDSEAFDSGIIIFKSDGYIPLWKYCNENSLKVLADVHTHPGRWTGQSSPDKQHPMISQRGHVALIVPCYATRPQTSIRGVGVYEYLGDKIWKTIRNKSKTIQIIK